MIVAAAWACRMARTAMVGGTQTKVGATDYWD
jgi:hypothetical protein